MEVIKTERKYYRKNRKSFYFYGRVERQSKTTSGSYLVSKGTTNAKFWMNYWNPDHPLNVGDNYRFEIEFATYADKEDGVIKMQIDVVNTPVKVDDNELAKGFVSDTMNVVINKSTCLSERTALIEVNRFDNDELKEPYHMRHFWTHSWAPKEGKATIHFDLQLTKYKMVGSPNGIDQGEEFIVYRTVKYKNAEGVDMIKSLADYKPVLVITKIDKYEENKE